MMIAATAALASPAAAAPQKHRNVNDIKTTITDSNIIFPSSYETDTRKMLEGWYMKNYTATDDSYKRRGDVAVSDAEIRDRLAKLPTVIDMPYNSIVRSYIERYTARGRDQVAALLGLSLYYMPIFEQALEENGLPLELKYLPIIESGLDPNAVSKHGAAGLWQFMIGTGKGLGMEVSSLVDERRDPYVSSQKAAKYLKDLYNSYGDWSLAIAAYNCGPGTVNKAIRRAGGDPQSHDFWSIYYYLSPETRGYVPMFIATNYVMNYYPKHNISPVLPTKPLVTDTILIRDRVHFDQISHVLDIPVEELRVLNPQFRADVIPGNNEKSYTLILPSQQVHAYLMSEEEIHDYEAERYLRRTVAEPGAEPSDQLAAEIIAEEDEALAADNQLAELQDSPRRVAEKAPETSKAPENQYAVARGRQSRSRQAQTASEPQEQTSPKTQKWSEPKSTRSSSSRSGSSKSRSRQATAPKEHTVKSGENLSTIAKKYGTTVEDLKRANNIKGSGDEIHPGDNITLPSKAKSGKSSKYSKSKKSKYGKSSSKKSSSKSKSKKRRR